MFSGIVQQIAELRSRAAHSRAQTMLFAYRQELKPPLSLGSSVCINGVCLTVTEQGDDYFAADVSAETIACSTLGGLPKGTTLNMEGAIPMGATLDGHLLSGHVDAVAFVRGIEEEGSSRRFSFGFSKQHEDISPYIASKGSVAVDGVSLTVNAVDSEGFEVNIVPYTLESTIFQYYKIDTPVNIEVDLLARYVGRLLESQGKIQRG
jgi:riboflavin synthase